MRPSTIRLNNHIQQQIYSETRGVAPFGDLLERHLWIQCNAAWGALKLVIRPQLVLSTRASLHVYLDPLVVVFIARQCLIFLEQQSSRNTKYPKKTPFCATTHSTSVSETQEQVKRTRNDIPIRMVPY